jgi:hypothetical protein
MKQNYELNYCYPLLQRYDIVAFLVIKATVDFQILKYIPNIDVIPVETSCILNRNSPCTACVACQLQTHEGLFLRFFQS